MNVWDFVSITIWFKIAIYFFKNVYGEIIWHFPYKMAAAQ